MVVTTSTYFFGRKLLILSFDKILMVKTEETGSASAVLALPDLRFYDLPIANVTGQSGAPSFGFSGRKHNCDHCTV